jgi:4-hydroxy-2-oxoheptanedioate aldolase
MRPSRILARIRAGQVARVCNTSHYLPFFPRLAAHFGYDGVWVDAEHGTWDAHSIKAMLAMTRGADVDAMFRPSTLEKSGLARCLEDGATGLMVPHVSTVEKARYLAECCKFPPLGDRGIDGAGIDGDFWVGKGANYPEDANRETFLCVQIETPQALTNVEEIAAMPGVDMLFLGPGDMSLRLQCQPSLRDPVMFDAFKKISAACYKNSKGFGLPIGDGEMARKAVDHGANLLAFGGEFFAVHDKLMACSRELDSALGESRSDTGVTSPPVVYQR